MSAMASDPLLRFRDTTDEELDRVGVLPSAQRLLRVFERSLRLGLALV